jgi:carbon dioxide concentrating mechanism protein CcmN
MTTYYVGDNVEVSADVAIASGAVLAAAPGSRLIVESGVCIGSGSVVQAHGGNLLISAGASLGRDVLIVGAGSIGPQACVGAESTLVSPQVEANQVIAARSLMMTDQVSPASSAKPDVSQNGSSHNAHSSQNGTAQQNGAAYSGGHGNGSLASNKVVYGRDQVMQLLKTLLPHRDSLNPTETHQEMHQDKS